MDKWILDGKTYKILRKMEILKNTMVFSVNLINCSELKKTVS